MANPEHVAMLKEGAAGWNQWREANEFETPDLSGADLNGANLDDTDLRAADLSGASLCNSRFCKAIFARASLKGASLEGANLAAAHLNGADLSQTNLDLTKLTLANLSSANLTKATLRGADLTSAVIARANLTSATLCDAKLHFANFNNSTLDGADFTGAAVYSTTFDNLDLSSTQGLDRVKHLGPASVGIDTLYKSKGEIPRVFLRGCGVPENLIEHIASLTFGGVQFYSLFISYSTKDQEFADRLHSDLLSNGVRCWFAPHHVEGGRKLHEQIDEAILVCDKLLLILSPHSIDSEWVKTEISKARKRELEEGRYVLFPIRLCNFEELRDWECFDADTGKDSAREIREYYIPDFSDWKSHNSYKEAFGKVLRNLQDQTAMPRPQRPRQ